MDDVNIICETEDSVCKEILQVFSTSFRNDYLLKNVHKKNDKRNVSSKFLIFIFDNSPTITEDINTKLDTFNPKEHFIMIILVTHGENDESRCMPSFNFPSAVRMWCSICGEDKKCPNSEENMTAKMMLECFLEISNMNRDKAMYSQDKRDIQETNCVSVICSEAARNFFQVFSDFMKTNVGVSTRQSENLKTPPYVALCVQHQDTEKEIQKLYGAFDSPASLIMIVFEDGVPSTPTELTVDKNIFPNIIYLRYSNSSKKIHDCAENDKAGENLKSKCITKTFLTTTEKSTVQPKPFHNPVILCNDKVEVYKDIWTTFTRLYSVPNEFRWESNAQNAMNIAECVLVCLKMSRLADDITLAIKKVDLSDTDKFYLVIIHTVEPGMDVDTSFSSRDPRILDIAHIVYSDNYGCYDCEENINAISRFRLWFPS